MLFNSFSFLVFLPLVFVLHWFVMRNSKQGQNLLLLIASYVFYAWWDPRFLSLIVLSTIVDYFVGKELDKTDTPSLRKRLLWLSIIFNLGMLAFFKYYNFFIDSWVDAFASVGYSMDPYTLSIVLPVGISFYTFQTMSYSLDIYRGNMKSSNDPIAFATYVAFFPQLVAGPIERASRLLPQIEKARWFNYEQAKDGARLVLWGMFKKVVIADSLAPAVNSIFDNHEIHSPSTLVIGAIYFAFQIYCDFSGYSDIAIGTAKLFGIELMSNFKFPYFSRNIGEFWRRWHISLSTWFRDYLYIPLGGSQGSSLNAIRNIFIIFLVSGFWHGANWTFLAWGFIHALLFIPLFLFKINRSHTDKVVAQNTMLPTIKELLQIGLTFTLVTVAWVFFRAESMTHAFSYLSGIISTDWAMPMFITEMIFVFIVIAFDWVNRKDERKVWSVGPTWFREAMYFILLAMIVLRWFGEGSEFIYFQF